MLKSLLISILCLYTELLLAQDKPARHSVKDVLAWNTSHVLSLTPPTLIRTATNTAAAATTITISSFDASGGNFVVIAFVMGTALTRSISSITINGVGATNIYTTNYISSTAGKIAIYGLVSPTTGDVVVTINNTFASGTAIAMLFNNVGGISASSGEFLGTARTSTSDTLSSLTTDLVVDALSTSTVGLGTPGGSQTLVAQDATALNGSANCSTQLGVAISTTMTWTALNQPLSWVGCVLNGK